MFTGLSIFMDSVGGQQAPRYFGPCIISKEGQLYIDTMTLVLTGFIGLPLKCMITRFLQLSLT